MSPTHDDKHDDERALAETTRDRDRRLVERLAQSYRPEPLDPAQRARFDAGLFDRIERHRRSTGWLPALAGVAAAAGLLWWAGPAATPEPGPETTVLAAAPLAAVPDGADEATVDAPADEDWESDVLLSDDDATLSEDEYLPGDYVVIAHAFIDGL